MNIRPKFIVVFLIGIFYFSLFVLLGQIVEVTTLLYIFLSLFSGFVYVGYEKLLCVRREEEKEVFCAPYELFLSLVFAPTIVYVFLSIINPSLFGTAAVVCVGTLCYRFFWFIIDPIIKR